MAAHKYRLLVTAGSAYDTSDHQLVPVNLPKPIHIKSSKIEAKLNVRIQNYKGAPSGSPETSAYFSHPPHEHDLYSISFHFRLPNNVPGNELVFGNDFDEPIRDTLPPGFGTAMRIVRWTIDPGIDGDAYADRPYLYGPLLSSINVLRVGTKPTEDTRDEAEVQGFSEGGDGDGAEIRKEKHVPEGSAQRMKHFLDESKRKDWVFEKGRDYMCDFFNPYLDFNEFSLKLPGNFTLPIIKYWNGAPLRYVLKHRTPDGSIDEPLLVIVVNLIADDQLEAEEQKMVDSGRAQAAREAASAAPDKDPSADKPASNEKSDYQDEGVD